MFQTLIEKGIYPNPVTNYFMKKKWYLILLDKKRINNLFEMRPKYKEFLTTV